MFLQLVLTHLFVFSRFWATSWSSWQLPKRRAFKDPPTSCFVASPPLIAWLVLPHSHCFPFGAWCCIAPAIHVTSKSSCSNYDTCSPHWHWAGLSPFWRLSLIECEHYPVRWFNALKSLTKVCWILASIKINPNSVLFIFMITRVLLTISKTNIVIRTFPAFFTSESFTNGGTEN